MDIVMNVIIVMIVMTMDVVVKKNTILTQLTLLIIWIIFLKRILVKDTFLHMKKLNLG